MFHGWHERRWGPITSPPLLGTIEFSSCDLPAGASVGQLSYLGSCADQLRHRCVYRRWNDAQVVPADQCRLNMRKNIIMFNQRFGADVSAVVVNCGVSLGLLQAHSKSGRLLVVILTICSASCRQVRSRSGLTCRRRRDESGSCSAGRPAQLFTAPPPSAVLSALASFSSYPPSLSPSPRSVFLESSVKHRSRPVPGYGSSGGGGWSGLIAADPVSPRPDTAVQRIRLGTK